MLKFVTHKRNFTPYFLIGPVLGKINFHRAMGRTTEDEGVVTTEFRNTKFKGGISVGLRGAVGVTVVLNRKLSLFSEITFTGMNYYPKESEITRYMVNGEDRLSLLTTNVRKTIYVDKVENDSDNATDDLHTPAESVRFPVAMSSMSANVGVLINYSRKINSRFPILHSKLEWLDVLLDQIDRNNRDIIVGNGPFIIVLSFIEVYEIAYHPKIAAAIGIISHVKIFYPFGIGLTTNPYAFDRFIPFRRKVYV